MSIINKMYAKLNYSKINYENISILVEILRCINSSLHSTHILSLWRTLKFSSELLNNRRHYPVNTHLDKIRSSATLRAGWAPAQST